MKNVRRHKSRTREPGTVKHTPIDANLVVEKDKHGLLYKVSIECQGINLVTTMSTKKEPALKDAKIQKLIRQMIHSPPAA